MNERLAVAPGERLLITDFDGTLTERDFYQLAIERLLPPETVDPWRPWEDYEAGRLTHFEALRRILAQIRADEPAMDAAVLAMGIEPNLHEALGRLAAAGWRVVVVSAGCRWYIDRLLVSARVAPTVFANEGELESSGALRLIAPRASPYFAQATGIDKRAIVRDALSRGATVAFAGDGRPDLAPALLAPPERRFARRTLARLLTERDEAFQSFDTWSDVVDKLLASEQP